MVWYCQCLAQSAIVDSRVGPYGTIPLLAPEVYAAEAYDPQPVDIFALAIFYCQMLVPYLPWKRDPSPTEWLDDTFGIFSLGGEDYGEPSASQSRRLMSSESDAEVDGRHIRAMIGCLVELLPKCSRKIISMMLEPEPAKRATWRDILADGWVRGVCE